MDDETVITGDDVALLPDPVGVLRKPVMVAGADDPPGSPLKTIEAGTDARNIPPSELAQLCQDHFE
jgi:hypothetical protein